MSHIPSALVPVTQEFAWGKSAHDSQVFTLVHHNTPHLYATTPDTQPFAELWLGTHPTGPTRVRGPLQTTFPPLDSLNSLETLQKTIDSELPYLFKVLSIKEPLSIQSHPDKSLARELHLKDPENYKDNNHKPELVVALTPMRVLFGFRNVVDIIENIKTLPLIAQVFGDVISEPIVNDIERKSALQKLWSKLYSITNDTATTIISQFLDEYSDLKGVYTSQIDHNSLNRSDFTEFRSGILALCYYLASLYPNDIAVFSPLFLHYFPLNPGESIFLPPNIPHAYLNGDCVEIMACSDNVIRAGLTPKFKDIDVLLSSLSYQMITSPSNVISTGDVLSSGDNDVKYTVYQPSVGEFDEFMLIETKFNENHDILENGLFEKTLPILPSKSILLCINGDTTISVKYQAPSAEICEHKENSITGAFHTGSAVYIPEFAQVTVRTTTPKGFLAYIAAENSSISTINALNDYTDTLDLNDFLEDDNMIIANDL